MKRENNQPLKESLDQFLDHFRLKQKAKEYKLIAKWETIVGPMIGKYTEEIKVHNNKLYLKINSSSVKHQLTMSREQVIDMVNTEIGEGFIKDIIFM